MLVHNECTRLPRNNGEWEGIPGESKWKSYNPDVNNITNGQGIPFKNGRPDFSEWSKGSFSFESGALDGTQKDFRKVYKKIKKQYNLKNQKQAKALLKKLGVTPPHYSLTEIQLIPTDLHANIPHVGAAYDLRNIK